MSDALKFKGAGGERKIAFSNGLKSEPVNQRNFALVDRETGERKPLPSGRGVVTALDLIEDYGERTAANGEPIDELFAVLVLMPRDDNPDTLMLASAIASHRCSGRGLDGIVKALAAWWPPGAPH